MRLAIISCLGILCGLAQAPKPFIITNVDAFDGARLLRGVNVLVLGGKIAALGKKAATADGAEVIDGKGRTLLPGLIDSHVHMLGLDSLREGAVFGVTTELDMFTIAGTAMTLKKDLAAGKYPDAARFQTAGTLATVPKGHGTEYGVPIPTITKPEEAQAFVDARIAEGCDYIKIIYDDGHTYGLNLPTLSKATLGALIEAAHKRHKMAVVHIGSLQEAREAIALGADGLAHLYIDQKPDPDFGKFVAAHHAFVIPTLSVLASITHESRLALLKDPRLAPYITASSANNLKASFPVRANAHEDYSAAVEAIHLLKAAKVPILAGTDAPNPGTTHGASLHGELKLLVDAGLTPLEALAAATSTPAQRFSMPDRGRIGEGARADLLLVTGDPSRDILATRDIVAVWEGGVRVDRDAWRAKVEKETQAKTTLRNAPPPEGSESGLISDFEDGKMDAPSAPGGARRPTLERAAIRPPPSPSPMKPPTAARASW